MEAWAVGSGDLLELAVGMVVGVLELGWGDIADHAVQPMLIPPVHPGQGGQLDLVGGPPWALAADQLGLEQPVDGFGQGVDAPMSSGAVGKGVRRG
jgi:hypothetical protein